MRDEIAVLGSTGSAGHGPAKRRIALVLTAAAALLAAPLALAGPPFLTDDPEPVDLRHWEGYLFSAYDRAVDATALQGPALEFNLGAAPNLQLHLVVPWSWNHPAGDAGRSGWGDMELGAKYRFVQETGNTPQIGIFPMVEMPTGSAAMGVGNGRASFKIPFWIQKSWGPWTSYGGAGWTINRAPGAKDHAFGGWLLQRTINEGLTLGGELFAQGADARDARGFAVANLGGIVKLTSSASLLLSAGHTIRGERHDVAYLALYWTGGPAQP